MSKYLEYIKCAKRGINITSKINLRKSFPYLIVMPAVIVLCMIAIVPIVYSFQISLTNLNFRKLDSLSFIGLANYWETLRSGAFWGALRATLIFVAGAVSLEFLLGLGIALLMVKKIPGIGIFRSFLVLPFAVAAISIGLMWRYLYGPGGILFYFLDRFGLQPAAGMIGNKYTAMIAIIIADTWQWTGFLALILLAGLLGISPALYDAAKSDGASGWQIFRYISFPLIKGVILVALIIRIMDAFCIFELVYAVTGGGPGTSTHVISYTIYKTGLRYGKIAYAATLSWLFVLMIVVISVILIRVIYRAQKI